MPYQIQQYTYGEAISQICKLVGHTSTAPADPAGSTDPAIQQMGAAINNALQELLTMHEWQDLTMRGSISVVADSAGQKEKGFSLPADFYRFVDETQWRSQSMMPAGGPITPQSWMAAILTNVSPVLTIYWQMREDQLWVLSPPYPTPATFEFMYLSNAQVVDADDPTTLKNFAAKNGDTFKLDSYLIMLLGRCRYLEWKGFDSSAATRDFLAVFNSRAGSDKGASTVSLLRRDTLPLINPVTSLPYSGYGT